MSKTAGSKKSKTESAGKKKPKRNAQVKPKPATAQTQLAVPSISKGACACGGGCPSCTAKTAQSLNPAPSPPKSREPDVAEIEARKLSPRLSLIGEAKAPPAPTTTRSDVPLKASPHIQTRERPSLRRIRAPDPRLTRHRRLSHSERCGAESAMDIDFSEVRLHTGAVANTLAAQSGALAFAHGNHIVLSARAERLSGASYERVLSHELIHVVQQSAPPLPATSRYQRPETRGPPIRPLIRTPPQVQCWVVTDAIGGFASDVGSAVYDVGADAVDGVVDFAGDVADVVGDGLRYVVDKVAPGLWKLLTGGALEMLGEWLCKGIDFVLGKVFGGLADVDIMTSLETTFTKLAKGITGIKDTMVGQLSDAVGAVLSPFISAMEWASPLIETAQGMVESVTDVFSGVWDNLAVPALELLETVGGAVWNGFKWLLGKLWGGVKAVKDFAGWAWDELSDLFGISWGGESDVKDTLSGYASDAFDALKKGYEKIKVPLLTAVAIFAMFSPLGPIIVLSLVLPPLYTKIKWLIENWDKAEVVVEARELLHKEIIPGIQNLIGGVKGALTSAAVWLAAMLGSIAAAIVRVIAAFAGGGCAKSINKILANIQDQVKRFQTWANGGFEGLNEALGAAFDALSAFFEPIFKFIAALIQVSAAPFTLPLVIVGAIWLLLPEPLKPAVIKFILDLIILAVSAIPTFMPGLFPLATIFKAGLLGFLRGLRGEDVGDDKRVEASNKVAGIMTGSLSFIAGFTVGILRGLIDGIIDPFKILFMLFDLIMKGVAVVGRVINTLIALVSPQAAATIKQANLAISGPPPPKAAASVQAQPQTTAAAPVPETVGTVGPRAPPQVLESRLTHGAQPVDTARAANTNAPPAAANTNAPPAGAGTIEASSSGEGLIDSTAAEPQNAALGGGAVPASDGESGEDVSLESDVTDEQIIANLPPGVAAQAGSALAGEVEFSPEGAETQMRGEVTSSGSTVSGLASILGGAWDYLISGAVKVGGMAAGWFMKFLAKPNYELGSKLGWLTGTILLELLINYFTAGGYMVIQKGATWGTKLLAYFVRYLDMGGAILGIMGKGLGKLRGPVLGGLDAAGGFLSRFKFIESILGRVRGAADWLFRFGDEIGLAADLARKGPVDGMAGRAATGLADEGAAGLAKQADEGLPPAPAVTRADDVVPPTPATHTGDVAPSPAPQRALDDASPTQRAVNSAAPDPMPVPAPARAADEASQAQINKAAHDAMEGAGNKPPRQGLDEAADGSSRTIDDAAAPTVKDDVLRSTEFPQAIGAARRVAEVNDVADMPIPVVMGQLLYLKRRYRWIDYFRARPADGPGVFKIGMVASPETEVDGHYDTEDKLIQVAPGVVRRPKGSRPRRPVGADPVPPPRDVAPDIPAAQKKGFDSDEVAEHFDEMSGGNGGMVPTGRSQNARIPDFPRRTERHTKQVMQLDNNKSFGGANEGMFNRHLDEGASAIGARFDRVAEQVHIRPIESIDANGNPVYANYTVIADNVGRDRATGALHILDAKTTPTAPLTKNQSKGYPLIAANGGRVESRGLGGPLAHHTDLPPTPVSRAIPNVKLSDPNVPMPAGGLDYSLTPVPAAPVSRTNFPVNPATPPHPSVSPPPSAGARPKGNAPRGVNETAEQAGERIGKHTADNAPMIDLKKSVDDVGDGSLRAVQDPATPTVRNPAVKAVELPEAIAAAKTITTAADVIDSPIEVVMGQLMLLKGRYRWIETFLATPRGAAGRFEIALIASRHNIDLIEVRSIFLYHGTPQAKARGLAQGMQAPNPKFENSAASHDLGPGLYLFGNPKDAETYAQKGGVIIEIELPLPHPDEIADIALKGFGLGGAPGTQRARFLKEGPTGAITNAEREAFGQPMWTTYKDRDAARNFTNDESRIIGSPFERNIARGQMFEGNVPPHAVPAQGGLGFEYDIIQWRIAKPTEDIRRQIIAHVLGTGGVLP